MAILKNLLRTSAVSKKIIDKNEVNRERHPCPHDEE
jgi:hypothetical protein